MTHDFLAFDTSTEHLGIALCVRGEVFVHEAAGGSLASATMIPTIRALLARAGVTLKSLDAIAFGRGPGAFTGLRTACSVAQGLAFGAGLPVLPIDTLLTIAEDARGIARRSGPAFVSSDVAASRSESLRVWATLDARMHEIYAAQYACDGGRWSVLDAPMLITPDALNERWKSAAPQMIAGNALVTFGDRLQTGEARCVPEALPRAAAMLPLALDLWSRGGAVEAALALPLYLRDKVAQTTVEREAAHAAKVAAAEAASASASASGSGSAPATPVPASAIGTAR